MALLCLVRNAADAIKMLYSKKNYIGLDPSAETRAPKSEFYIAPKYFPWRQKLETSIVFLKDFASGSSLSRLELSLLLKLFA